MSKKIVRQLVSAPPGHDLLWYLGADADGPAAYSADPIIAWALVDDGDGDLLVEPVTLEQIGYPSHSPSAVRFPDGRVVAPDEANFDSADAWVAEKTRWIVWVAVGRWLRGKPPT